MRTTSWVAAAVLALALALTGCSSSNNPLPPPDSGTPRPDGGLPDGGLPDGGQPDGGQPDGGLFVCASAGTTCSSGATCCSGLCDPNTSQCYEQPPFCRAAGAQCTVGSDCCSGTCNGQGVCGSNACLSDGVSCTLGTDCCSGVCNGTCQSPNGGACKITGDSCTAGSQCCSSNCQGGQCIPAFTCGANNDLCHFNSGCCSNSCSVNDGGSGFCNTVSGGGCTQDGNPCGATTKCCSRVCSDPGSGVTVCAVAAGCRMTNDSCTGDAECCGSANNGVTCRGTTTKVCTNGQSCNPPGNTCGERVLADGGSVNSSQNCCNPFGNGGSTGHPYCKLDSAGIPRCYGYPNLNPDGGTDCPTGYTGQAGCCIDTGNRCDFSDECCNGAKCIPDQTGTPVCTMQSCQGLGADCRGVDGGAGNGCCAGSVCAPTGEFGLACQLPGTIPDGGTGTDAGVCSGNGNTCATSADCCSGICADTGSGLQCQTPSSCQPQNSTCSTSADCCSGLNCASDSTGALSCQPASCPQSGQTCSPTSPCCSGLSCVDSTFVNCAGTSACSCQVVIH